MATEEAPVSVEFVAETLVFSTTPQHNLTGYSCLSTHAAVDVVTDWCMDSNVCVQSSNSLGTMQSPVRPIFRFYVRQLC